MRISSFVYLILFTYPVITLLTPEPSFFRWWLRTGGAGPVPAEIEARRIRNQGNLLIAKFVLLIAACFIFIRIIPISSKFLGLRPGQPIGLLFVGSSAAILIVIWIFHMRGLEAKIRSQAGMPPFLLRESTLRLLVIMSLGSLAEELWRALALTIFHQAGISDLSAVLLTSVVFGIGHVFSYESFGAALGRILPPAVAGAFLGTLFLWSQTLFIPFIFHLLINSFGALMGRKRLIANQDSLGAVSS